MADTHARLIPPGTRDGEADVRLTRLDPKARHSLAFGVTDVAPGTLSALTVVDGVTVPPRDGRSVRFGRNRPEVDLCVGEDDLQISRQHGDLVRRHDLWWVRNIGRSPIRLSTGVSLPQNGEPSPLAAGYTALFLRGARNREHLVELYVAGPDGSTPTSRPGEVTQSPARWRLTADERLALVVLGQRFLRHEPHPQPLSRQQAADQLGELQPQARWTAKRVEHLVLGVRKRLSDNGVPGLRREEVGEPVGLTLTVNLFAELVSSATLVPPDLGLLDGLD